MPAQAVARTFEEKTSQALSGKTGFTPMDASDEAALAARIKAGDRDAAWALALANHNFVRSIAARYLRSDIEIEDLVSEGLLGLAEAAVRFDPDRGIKFISYGIWWIKRSILRYLRTFEHAVHVPKYKQLEMQGFWRIHRRLSQDLGRVPTLEEVSSAAGVSMATAQELVALSAPADSLESDPETMEGRAVVPGPDAETATIENETIERLRGAIPQLPSREQDILRRRFGLDGDEPMTLATVGLEVKLTKERVRQIEKAACVELRKVLEGGTARAVPLARGHRRAARPSSTRRARPRKLAA